ncbi:MAG: MMPL family transporter [Gammaproteobacteria bacterium]|nr:MMPL family transporter [Gammaproteobacteria bacterium]MCP5138096.1 MMPL family transporter [Gammaproteobacteria bacterium]
MSQDVNPGGDQTPAEKPPRTNGRDWAGTYARWALSHRKLLIFSLFAFTLLAALFVNKIDLRNDPDSLLPLSNRYISTNLYADRHYGMGNLMVWGFVVKDGDIFQPWFINMLRDFYLDAAKLDYAKPVNFAGIPSPKLRNLGLSEDGSLDFKRLLPASGLSSDPEEQHAQIEYLRKGLEHHLVMEPLLVYYRDADGNKCNLLDENGRMDSATVARVQTDCKAVGTFIIGDFNDKLKDAPVAWVESAQALLAKYQAEYGDRVEFQVSGEPWFLASMVQEIWDKAWLIGISLLIVLLILYHQFRHWGAALLPLLGVGMTIVLTLGLMGYTQFKLTTMMALTPLLLLAIGIGHAMQITRRFLQELERSGNPEKAAYESIRHTIVPAALSIGTDLHGFVAISFVDISFYKAYAWFGIFGLTTLILTTTTLIPLVLMWHPPKLHSGAEERPWTIHLARGLTRLLTGRWKWLPVAAVLGVIWLSAHEAQLGRGVSAILAGEAGRSDPEVARIQDEFDIMPGAEKGIDYPRAAYKDHTLMGELTGDGDVPLISDLMSLSEMMPGVITANIVVRSKAGTLPPCGADAWNADGDRIIGPDRCWDEQEDPVQGVFNSAEVMEALARFEDWLRGYPHIGFSVSYVQFVKTLNMMLNAPDGEPPLHHMELYAIPTPEHMAAHLANYGGNIEDLPDPDASVRLYNGILSTSAGAGELDAFVNTASWDEAVIVAFVNTMDPVESHRTIRDIQDWLLAHADDPGMDKLRFGVEAGERITASDGHTVTVETQDDPRPAMGGFLGVTEATRDVAFEEWIHAPLATSTTVFLMSAIMFRSWLAAGILIALCFITLLTQYGLGGYMTAIKEWSANLAFHTQVALSIAMGLGVDYGVYMLARLREEMCYHKGSWKEALEATLSSTGGAIILAVAVLLASFIPLMNTQLANLWSVSLYIAEALVLDLLLALLFLPLLVEWLKPKFVFAQK